MDDRIALIKSSFVAFNVIGISFGEAAQDEIRALGVSLYTGGFGYTIILNICLRHSV